MKFTPEAEQFEKCARGVLNSAYNRCKDIREHRVLGDRCGFSHVTANNLLSGKQRLTFAYFATIAQACGQDPFALMKHVAKKMDHMPYPKPRRPGRRR